MFTGQTQSLEQRKKVDAEELKAQFGTAPAKKAAKPAKKEEKVEEVKAEATTAEAPAEEAAE